MEEVPAWPADSRPALCLWQGAEGSTSFMHPAQTTACGGLRSYFSTAVMLPVKMRLRMVPSSSISKLSFMTVEGMSRLHLFPR